jgi:hypothetical protein
MISTNNMFLIGFVIFILFIVFYYYKNNQQPPIRNRYGWSDVQFKNISDLLLTRPLLKNMIIDDKTRSCLAMNLKAHYTYERALQIVNGDLNDDDLELLSYCIPIHGFMSALHQKFPDLSQKCIDCIVNTTLKATNSKRTAIDVLNDPNMLNQIMSSCKCIPMNETS